MKIGIGILAHNEAGHIQKTLESLLSQSLFNQPNSEPEVELVVVPNGCTDETASLARIALTQHLETFPQLKVRWKVHEIAEPGKARAWNTYVHNLADTQSDYLILMDADIEFLNNNTLASMIDVLEQLPEVWVSVDQPLKDIIFKSNKTFMEQLSVLVSNLSGKSPKVGEPAWICGQLYCARSQKLRQIWLPNNLSADDAFVYDLITTDGLRSHPIESRVVLADTASHIFEAYTDINRLFRHERWQIFSSVVNQTAFNRLQSMQAVDGDNKHAGTYVNSLNSANPNWLNDCVKEEVDLKGFWLIPSFILTRRFRSLRGKSIPKLLLLLPVATLAFFVDLLLSVQANNDLHRGSSLRYWGKS